MSIFKEFDFDFPDPVSDKETASAQFAVALDNHGGSPINWKIRWRNASGNNDYYTLCVWGAVVQSSDLPQAVLDAIADLELEEVS